MIYKVCGKQKYLYPELLSISGFYWTLANLSAAGTSACLILVLAIIVVASYLNSHQSVLMTKWWNLGTMNVHITKPIEIPDIVKTHYEKIYNFLSINKTS